MIKKDPLIKAKEDLERILRDSNKNIKRIAGIIKSLGSQNYYVGSQKLSLGDRIDYDILGGFIGKYTRKKKILGIRAHVKEIFDEEGITTNGELLSAYPAISQAESGLKLSEAGTKGILDYIRLISH